MKRLSTPRTAALALGTLLFASCATQQQYKDAVDLAKHYQDELNQAQLENSKLSQENKRLGNELTMAQVSAMEAGSTDPELQARLDELQQRLASLSGNPDGISRVDLDGGAYVYMVPDAVLFALGSAEVGDEGRRQLVERVAADIRSAAHGRIWVRGHTDSVPVARPETLKKYPHGNLQLSVARAIEVAAILSGPGGVPREDVVVAGFGPYEPLTTNDTPENRRLNRRVEIFVSPAN